MLVNLRKSLLRELDFTIEANNLHTIGQNLAEFEDIVVPEPIDDFTTTRILTMEYISGKKITALNPLRLFEIEGGLLADELFSAYLKQFLIDGLFHADPHPGNVFLTDDDRIALIDLGMVGRVTRTFQDNLLRLCLQSAKDAARWLPKPRSKWVKKKRALIVHRFEGITDLVADDSDAF
jgi:ubiquinone biosynthesis protein